MIGPEYECYAGRMAEMEARARTASRAHRLAAARRAGRRAEKAARLAARLDAAVF